uniref:Uncharacterized protein n=1 Tax=Arundo donax TaxID=35708 RepID=A0A0A8YD70_ARUDO
MHCDIGQSSL